ncbi:uncharacterized protein CXorf65-like [Montipora capricornis]|uniref:uncharacterized protein CXorf65-like n=1 Tax=Montipora capricornis TaxID=246305 RepID=UPI0035F1F82F
MFITVKYGDHEEALFNPNCRILHLLEDIKRRCNCPENVIIDLSDLSGSVKNLANNQSSNASDFLEERETLILVRVEKNPTEGRDVPLYTPLLRDENVLTAGFLETLRRTPTDTLDVCGRSSRSTRRGSLKPSIKTKVSAAPDKLSPTAINPTGMKSLSGRRRSSTNRKS